MTILLAGTSVLAALLYCVAGWLAGRTHHNATAPAGTTSGFGPPGTSSAASSGGSIGSWLMLLGLIAHIFTIVATARAPADAESLPALRFGFALALSSVLWLGVAILWFEGFRIRLDALRVLILPLAAVAVLLPMFFPGADHSSLSRAPLFLPHLFVGTLAIGVLVMAAMHALLMMAADRALHRRAPDSASLFARWFDQMPPLMALERILFRFIFTGFVLLTLTVGSGVLFSDQVFGRAPKLDHKTLFSIAAWLLFGVLLLGRLRWGWRGRTAWRMTLSGVIFLLLGYVGSRFVLEVILKRY